VGDTQITMEGLHYGLGVMCAERGWHHGVPVFSCTDQGHALILAKGSPLSEKGYGPKNPFTYGKPNKPKPTEEELDGLRLVNAWRPTPTSVQVYEDNKGRFKLRIPDAHMRFRTLMDTLIVRAGAVVVHNEYRALQLLVTKINQNQWESYILSGAFPETSKRSGVTYIFRKGFPTIAMRERMLPEGGAKREFLAALCMHPLAYYEDTFAGSYPPTDEVLAHLLLMRADEHAFWKRYNQHELTDPLSGI